MKKPIDPSILCELYPHLVKLTEWNTTTIKGCIEAFQEHWGFTKGETYMAIRYAVSGSTVTCEITPALELLGKERTLSRIGRFIAFAADLEPMDTDNRQAIRNYFGY